MKRFETVSDRFGPFSGRFQTVFRRGRGLSVWFGLVWFGLRGWSRGLVWFGLGFAAGVAVWFGLVWVSSRGAQTKPNGLDFFWFGLVWFGRF